MSPVSRRIRVLDLRDTHEIGGPGKTILETFKAADASRFDLRIGVYLAPNDTLDNPFTQAARDMGMPVHVIRGAHSYDPRLIVRTATLVRQEGIDIVHAHEVRSDVLMYLASFLSRARIMTTVHGYIANSRKQRTMVAGDKRLVGRFDRTVVVSAKLRDELLALGVSPRVLRLVHNGLVLENYRRSDVRGAIAELAGRAVPGPVLVSIGRLSREKGHADLLQALGMVTAQGRRVSLVLAGDGPERTALESQARTLGIAESVHFLGYVGRPQVILNEADLMVLPSHTEGLPNAALEALAMDVPVLATAVGGTPEVITDGATGRLVPAHAPEAMAAGIIDFLDHRDRWRQWTAAGRQVVEQQFDFRARTRKMEAIYEELVEGVRT